MTFEAEYERAMAAAEMREELIDGLAREVYHVKSQSPREMTDERWARIKIMFPGSVRACREQALEELARMEEP